MEIPRKNVEVSVNKKEIAPEKGEEEVAEKVAKEKEPAVHYSLYAFFASIDEEGYKIKNEFKSEGATAKELLKNLDFPKGTNCLVNVTVQKNGHELSKALAPHKARAILNGKNVYDFEQAFRGI